MSTHITKLSSYSFYYLYNIRRLRKYLSRRCAETLVHAFITARIDYCNSLLYGRPEYRINKLRRIQNAAARLICQQSRFCHITSLLLDLHWLPVKFLIIRLAPRADKMNRNSRCDWLPVRARWSCLGRSGYGLCPTREVYHLLVF